MQVYAYLFLLPFYCSYSCVISPFLYIINIKGTEKEEGRRRGRLTSSVALSLSLVSSFPVGLAYYEWHHCYST